MDNSFDFVLPSLLLRDCIENYYMAELSGTLEGPEIEQKPLSNGRVELFVGYQNTRGTCCTNAGAVIKTQSAIVGAHKLQNNNMGMALDVDCKEIKFVSINFKPGGFYGIFKIPPSIVYNGFFETQDVLGREFQFLQDQLSLSKTTYDRKRLVDRFLLSQFNKNYHKHYRINTGLDMAAFIESRKGNVHIQDVVAEFGFSERTLERNFKAALGLSLKEYAKIVRFNKMFDHINTASRIDWADIVYQYGYYDQAHMINEFKSATGITPGLFLKHRHKTLFKLDNHLVMLDPAGLHNELNDVMKRGEDTYNQSLNKYAAYK